MVTNLNYPNLNYPFLEAIYQVFTIYQIDRSAQYLRRVLQEVNNVAAAVSGKDSLAAFHFFCSFVGTTIPVIINRYVGRRRLPDHVVNELYNIVKSLGADVMITEFQWDGHSNLFLQIARHFKEYDGIVTGLRRQEDGDWPSVVFSNNRRVVIIAPLWNWRHTDVWAYLLKHRIPVPEAYRGALPWESLQSRVLTI